jgi:hypothetical protein
MVDMESTDRFLAAETHIGARSSVKPATPRGSVMRKMQAGSLAELVNMDARLRLATGQVDRYRDLSVFARSDRHHRQFSLFLSQSKS